MIKIKQNNFKINRGIRFECLLKKINYEKTHNINYTIDNNIYRFRGWNYLFINVISVLGFKRWKMA